MSLTPRRTARSLDAGGDIGHAKAQSEGHNLTSVLGRLLEGYLSWPPHRITRDIAAPDQRNVSRCERARRRAGRKHPPLSAGAGGIERYDVSAPRLFKRKAG